MHAGPDDDDHDDMMMMMILQMAEQKQKKPITWTLFVLEGDTTQFCYKAQI